MLAAPGSTAPAVLPESVRPFYKDGAVTIYCGDCREILPQLGPVDHVITDPPYAARAMKNARSAETIKQRRDGKMYDFGYTALSDTDRHTAAVLTAALVKRWALYWCDLESFHAWRAEVELAGLRYIRGGIWVRELAAPQFSGDRPGQGVEACVIAHGAGQRLRWNGGGRSAAWVGPIVNAQDASRVHKSPKPEWLMLRLVKDFTDTGDLILDPFGGSGTTAVAAKRLGRRCILIEQEDKYCQIAAQRCQQGALDLFPGATG